MTDRINVGRAVWAGLIAGLVFMMMEMILVATVGGGSAWGPPRMIAAIGMGKDVLPPPATFDLMILMVAMVIHFALSIVLALIFAFIASKMKWSGTMAIVAGLVFGLIVYVVTFHGMTAVFPWFEMARGWIAILSHAVFGGVLGWWYAGRTVATV